MQPIVAPSMTDQRMKVVSRVSFSTLRKWIMPKTASMPKAISKLPAITIIMIETSTGSTAREATKVRGIGDRLMRPHVDETDPVPNGQREQDNEEDRVRAADVSRPVITVEQRREHVAHGVVLTKKKKKKKKNPKLSSYHRLRGFQGSAGNGATAGGGPNWLSGTANGGAAAP